MCKRIIRAPRCNTGRSITINPSNDDVELLLLAGLPVPIAGAPDFCAPALKRIAGIGSSRYDRILSALLVNKDHSDMFAASGLTSFEIFYVNCEGNPLFWDLARTGLELLLGSGPRLAATADEVFVGFGESAEKRLDNRNFDDFQRLLMYSHQISLAKEAYKPANAKAQALIERLGRGKDEILGKKEQLFTLASKISGIAWKSHTVNIFNVFDLNIFQFHDALSRLELVDNYLFTIQGIYAGNVDGKKVNFNQLHWSRKHKGV